MPLISHGHDPPNPRKFLYPPGNGDCHRHCVVAHVLAALSFWQQEKASAEANGWLVHTYEVIAQIESLLSKLQNAETEPARLPAYRQ